MRKLSDSPVLRFTVALMVPIITVYAFYVQFFGEEGPGGGFQAGAILASAFVLHSLVYGASSVLNVVSYRALRTLSAVGVLTYLCAGIAPMLVGGKYLEYSSVTCAFFSGESCVSLGNKVGIFIIELGIGLTVFSVITLIVLLLVERVPEHG